PGSRPGLLTGACGARARARRSIPTTLRTPGRRCHVAGGELRSRGRDRSLPREPVALRVDAARLPDRPRAVRDVAGRTATDPLRRRHPGPERVHRRARPAATQARAGQRRPEALGDSLAAHLRARPRARPRRGAGTEASPPAAVGAEGRRGRRAARRTEWRWSAGPAEPRAGRARLL